MYIQYVYIYMYITVNYICICMCVHMYPYIYIYIEREREREKPGHAYLNWKYWESGTHEYPKIIMTCTLLLDEHK